MGYKVFPLYVCLLLLVSLSATAQSPGSWSDQDQLMRMPGTDSGTQDAGSMLRGGGSISGAVRTQDNRPVNNARVEIRDTMNGYAIATGYTGPSGAFEVNNLPRGNYEIVADSGLSEAREQVRMDGTPMQFTLRLPHTGGGDTVRGGQQTVSLEELSTPPKAQNAYQKAQESFSKGKYEDARKEISKALAVAPRFSDAMTLRGILNLQSGNVPQAEQDLQQAIQFNNNNAMAYVGMASIYNMKSQFDDAIRELDRATALAPTAWQAHFELSKANLGKGLASESLKEVNRAEGLLGHSISQMHIVRGQALFVMKSYKDAAAEFSKYLAEEKDDPDAGIIKKALAQAQAAEQAAK